VELYCGPSQQPFCQFHIGPHEIDWTTFNNAMTMFMLFGFQETMHKPYQ